MKEQVSMMRSACAVVTCWFRWACRRAIRAGWFFGGRRPSGLEGGWEEEEEEGGGSWREGVVMFSGGFGYVNRT